MLNWDAPLPRLPPNPTPVAAPTPGLPPVNLQPLTPQQQQEVQDLLHKYPGVSQSDVENLVRLGYDEASIRAILSAGFTHEQIAIVIARTQVAIKNGVDQYGLTPSNLEKLFVDVANALNSGDKDKALAAQTALSVAGNLISFERKVIDPNTHLAITDIDVETPNAIIEVTNASQGKLDQIRRQQTNPYINPSGKPVILFGPRYSPAGAKNLKSLGIPYAKTFDELKQLLKEMFGGA